MRGDLDELPDHVALGGDDEDLLPAAAVFSPGVVDSTWKSRMASSSGIGMASWAWNSMAARSSLASMIGNSMVRTTIFWLATPSENRLPVNPALLPERLELRGETVDVDDLALEHEPVRERARGDRHERVPLATILDLDTDHRGLLDIDAHTHRIHRHTRPSACLALAPVSAPAGDTFRHSFRRVDTYSLLPKSRDRHSFT